MAYTPPLGKATLIEFDVLSIEPYVGQVAISIDGESVATLVETVFTDGSDGSSLFEFDLSRHINAVEISYDLNFYEKATNYNLNFGAAAAPPILLFATLSCGEMVSGNLLATKTLSDVNFYTGESLGQNYVDERDLRQFPAIAQLPFPRFLGLSFYTSGYTWPAPYAINSGVAHTLALAFGTQLTINPPAPLILPDVLAISAFFNGENRPVYSLTTGFQTLGEGQSLSATLNIQWDLLNSSLQVGETATFAIATRPVISPNGLILGQSLVADITTESTRTDLSVGENVKAELDVYDLITSSLYNGSILAGELTTSAAMASLLGHGEALSVSVEFHPTFYPYCSLSSGESLVAALATTTKYECTLSVGESVIALLDFRPGLELTAGLSCGESAFVSEIRAAPGLFPNVMGDGVAVVVASLDEELPWRLWSGVTIAGILETTAGFQGATAYDGQTLTGEVNVRPSQPISVSFYQGESFLPERPYVQHRAYLSATIFVGQSPSACFEDMTVDFDLRGPIKLDTTDWFWNPDKFRAESEDLPVARGWGDGCGETVFAELQCRPRFSSTMATGESFRSERGYEFVDSTLADSVVIPLNDPIYIEPLVALCYPNLFPYADNIEVELEWEEIKCSSDFVYTGETVHGSLGMWRRFGANFYAGESFFPDFTLDPALRCMIWHGCSLRSELATTYGIGARLYDGVSSIVEFERESSYISTGESVTGNIDMTFYVEFAEVGCLDNEFIPINENGDPDISKRLPVCVEGYAFLHDLKARCY